MDDATVTEIELARDAEEALARDAAMIARYLRRTGLALAASQLDELSALYASRAADIEWLSY